MRLSKSWVVASKDFEVFGKKKNIIYTMVIVPLLVSFLLPAVLAVAKKPFPGIPWEIMSFGKVEEALERSPMPAGDHNQDEERLQRCDIHYPRPPHHTLLQLQRHPRVV